MPNYYTDTNFTIVIGDIYIGTVHRPVSETTDLQVERDCIADLWKRFQITCRPTKDFINFLCEHSFQPVKTQVVDLCPLPIRRGFLT